MSNFKHIAEDWDQFEAYRKKRLNGVKTGFTSLDNTIMGLPGLTGILGEPGSYKSTFCLQVAAYHAKNYGPVIYYDAENGLNRVRSRIICNIMGVTTSFLLHTNDADFLKRAKETLASYPLYIFSDISYHDVDELFERCLAELSAKRLMFVVDSLQTLPMIHENKRYSLSSWMYKLNDLKKRYEGVLSILAPIEKKRGTYETSGMDSGKESGDIEYKSEVLLDIQNNKKGVLTLSCIKDRDGPLNTKIQLQPVLVDKNDPSSFCYRLQEMEVFEL